MIRALYNLQFAYIKMIDFKLSLKSRPALISAFDQLVLTLRIMVLAVLKSNFLITPRVFTLSDSKRTVGYMIFHITSFEFDIASILVNKRLLVYAANDLIFAFRVNMI